ncbi:hypothetical protein [Mycobacteroides abscessus]|uniref:hypothetical protein n=1 Tax=Mycobacteroides abscessus TaxID=36809 RepID=UPI0012FFDFA8|nr:hypothetical protein [Mycobacteroides abscessus]
MIPASPGDHNQPECVYFATPEELEAARELAQHHCPKADDHRALDERDLKDK